MRWTDLIQVDDSSSSLELAPGYLGTEVPKNPKLLPHQFRQPAPAASSQFICRRLAHSCPTRQSDGDRDSYSSSLTGVRASLLKQGPLPQVSKQVHGRQKGRKLSQLRHLVAAIAFSYPGSKLSLLVTPTNHSQASLGTRQKFSCWSL